MKKQDEMWMRKALSEAEIAFSEGEVPVGAVVVRGDELIASARNSREHGHDATAHAEIEVVREACRRLGRWRLDDCELYVTLEPCPMCAGAILNARLARVVYGAKDPHGGAFDSVINLRAYPFCARPEVEGGVLAAESSQILSDFFAAKRNRKKSEKSF